MKRILVTGAAGFIGSSLVLRLLERGDLVIGLDNHNDYYNPKLKEDRLNRYLNHINYSHFRVDIQDNKKLESIFSENNFEYVVNLAAQAGVRYSMENPSAYIGSNILGFSNILECSKNHEIKHLVYASSSSIYGANTKMPFSIHDNSDHPQSLYGATKKANELLAHSYSHLYNLPTTGLRFFTVYGPWGRPDMALYKFTESILGGEIIKVFNHGNHKRDFTYIDDIVDGLLLVIDNPAQSNPAWVGSKPDPGSSNAPWRIYNIGNSSPVNLIDYIQAIESALGISAKKQFLPLQPGDIVDTYADVKDLEIQFNYKPTTSVKEGVASFVSWYKSYYNYE